MKRQAACDDLVRGIDWAPLEDSYLVEVTPQRAAEWLDRTCGNRKIRSSHIATLAAQMTRGEWLLTHEAIAFDRNKVLVDGHHRLRAIIAAGEPQALRVVFGVDPDVKKTGDSGVQRSLADRMIMTGDVKLERQRDYQSCQSIMRILFRHVASAPRPPSYGESQAMWEHIGGDIRFVLEATAPFKHLHHAAVRSALCLFSWKFGEDVAAELIEGIGRGAGLKLHSGALAMREYLVKRNMGRSDSELAKDATSTIFAKCIKCLHAHRNEREVRVLRDNAWRKMFGEMFGSPKMIGVRMGVVDIPVGRAAE